MATEKIFISLHTLDDPEYYHPDTFMNEFLPKNILYLGASVTEGNPPYGDSYKIPDEGAVQNVFNGVDPLSKLFFVESNSAHHITKFIVKRTYERLLSQEKISSEKKILVVNFDQHTDFEGKDANLFCGNWGSHLRHELPAADYMVIGLSKYRTVTLWENNGTEPNGRNINESKESLTSIYDKYASIYVTVDMDVLEMPKDADGRRPSPFANLDTKNATRTNWSNGFMPLDELTGLLENLPECKIAAADITGFPPLKSKTTLQMQNTDILDSHITDISAVAEILSKKIM